MYFSVDKYLTLDDSAILEVYSGNGHEFIFKMPLKKKELKQLQKVLVESLAKIERDGY